MTAPKDESESRLLGSPRRNQTTLIARQWLLTRLRPEAVVPLPVEDGEVAVFAVSAPLLEVEVLRLGS